jgi:Zn-finger domain-containing protein
MKEKRERNAEKKRYTPILRVGVDENVAGMKIAVDKKKRKKNIPPSWASAWTRMLPG